MINQKDDYSLRDIIIDEIMIPALMMLYRVDYDNIYDGVSERNICARLALHMENIMRNYDRTHNIELFKGYYVDVEYDKMNHREQKFYENYLHERKRMVSDLLIQSRGENRNLLAIEMKRWKSYNKRKEDRDRLRALVSPVPENNNLNCVYGTLVGAFVIYSKEKVKIELYENIDGRGDKNGVIPMGYDVNQRELILL